jgi:hypothetical protein
MKFEAICILLIQDFPCFTTDSLCGFVSGLLQFYPLIFLGKKIFAMTTLLGCGLMVVFKTDALPAAAPC